MWAVTRPIGPGSAAGGRLLALGEPAVAAHVAALGADDDVDGVARAPWLRIVRTVGGSTRATPPGPRSMRLAVPELDLDLAAVDEVELLLALVVVAGRSRSRRQDDRVDAELGHAELAADLAEPVPLAHLVDVSDRVAVALAIPIGRASYDAAPRAVS